MIAQAEHIPVHLGAMPDAVAAVLAARDPSAGEVWALNDPYTGGTHLPDITLVSRTDVGFAVSRAHHADVGGMRAAARCPRTRATLDQEGVVIPPTRLDDEVDAHPRRQRCAIPTSGGATCARRSPRTGSPSSASPSSARGAGANASSPRWTSSTRTRSAMMRAAIAALPDGRYRGRTTCSRPIDGDLEIHATVDDRGRRGRDRLHRHRAAARRQPQLPARRSRARRASTSCACSSTRTSRRRAARSRRSR